MTTLKEKASVAMAARSETYTQVREALRPFHARPLNYMKGPKDTAIYCIEMFLICSRQADAGTPEDPRYSWQGLVLVQFWKDGGCAYFFAEDFVMPALGVKRTGRYEDMSTTLDALTAAIKDRRSLGSEQVAA